MTEDKMPRSKEVPDERIIGVLEESDDPVMTTTEISKRLSLTRQGVANRLEELVAEGRIHRKKPNRDVFYWL